MNTLSAMNATAYALPPTRQATAKATMIVVESLLAAQDEARQHDRGHDQRGGQAGRDESPWPARSASAAIGLTMR